MSIFGGRRKGDDHNGPDSARLRRAAAAETRGISFLTGGNLADAELELRRALALNPQSASCHGHLALTLYHLKRYVEANVESRDAVYLAPTDDVLRHTQGIIFEAMDRLDEAAIAYCRAIELNSDSAQGHAALGSLSLKRGDVEAAESLFATALRLDPDQKTAVKAMADIRRQGASEDAVSITDGVLPERSAHAALNEVPGATPLDEENFQDLSVDRSAFQPVGADFPMLLPSGNLPGEQVNLDALPDRYSPDSSEQAGDVLPDRAAPLLDFTLGSALPVPLLMEAPACPDREVRLAQAAPSLEPAIPGPPVSILTKAATESPAETQHVAPALAPAISALEAKVNGEPSNSRLYRDLSILYLRAGRLTEAIEMGRKAEQLHSVARRLDRVAWSTT